MPAEPLARSERPLTGPFWEHVDRRELVRPVCSVCRRSFFVPQVVCGRCQSGDWSYQPSSGRGVVYSHTTVHRPPTPEFSPPYVLAVVDVCEGDWPANGRSGGDTDDYGEDDRDAWSMLTWIVGCEPERVRIGMQVVVRFVPGPNGELLPAFTPAASEDAA